MPLPSSLPSFFSSSSWKFLSLFIFLFFFFNTLWILIINHPVFKFCYCLLLGLIQFSFELLSLMTLSPKSCTLIPNRNRSYRTLQTSRLETLSRLTSTNWQENHSNQGNSSCAQAPLGGLTAASSIFSSQLNSDLDAHIQKSNFLRISPSSQQRTLYIHK